MEKIRSTRISTNRIWPDFSFGYWVYLYGQIKTRMANHLALSADWCPCIFSLIEPKLLRWTAEAVNITNRWMTRANSSTRTWMRPATEWSGWTFSWKYACSALVVETLWLEFSVNAIPVYLLEIVWRIMYLSNWFQYQLWTVPPVFFRKYWFSQN